MSCAELMSWMGSKGGFSAGTHCHGGTEASRGAGAPADCGNGARGRRLRGRQRRIPGGEWGGRTLQWWFRCLDRNKASASSWSQSSSSSASSSNVSSSAASSSTSEGNVVNGSGRHRSEARAASGFDRVALNGIGHLVLTQTAQDSLTIEGDDNILPEITSQVSQGVLHLGVKSGTTIRPSLPIVYHLAMRNIAGIQQEGVATIQARSVQSDDLDLSVGGSGWVQIDQLQARNLGVAIDGSGSVRLAGDVGDQRVQIGGAGDYRADHLSSQSARVAIQGSGNCALWVAGKLDAEIFGSGNITYSGDPTVTRQIVGAGTVSPA